MCANLLKFVAVLVLTTTNVFSQNQNPEFIESSSPLPGGGRVVSRSTPGSEIQTVASPPPSENVQVNSVRNNPVSATTAPPRESVFRQAIASTPVNTTATTNATAPRYVYPGNNQYLANARTSPTALFYQPVRASATCTNCAVPYQIPSLGLTNTVQTGRQVYAPNNCCSPATYGTTTTLQVPAAQVPTLQIQPPANQVPSLGSNLNFQTPQFQVNPNVGVPQFNPQRSSFLSPFVTGSGAYQPIIRIANVPPGTYVGQGVIGQPVAYVDGQPVRNLLRYVFP